MTSVDKPVSHLTPVRPSAPFSTSVVNGGEKPPDSADWDDYAQRTAARKKAPDWAVLREARASHYRDFFRIQPGERVLDAGCGHGEYTVFALRDGARVWAIDTSKAMIAHTRRSIREAGVRAEAVSEQSVLDIQYPANYFDVVMNLSVLETLNDPAAALRELVRILRPGGQLYLDVCNAVAIHWHACFRVMQFLRMGPAGHMRYFTPAELKTMVRKTGCRPIEDSGMHFCPPFSGIYTADLRRFTILPESLIRPLDRLYLAVERQARRHWPTRLLCHHYILRAVKQS